MINHFNAFISYKHAELDNKVAASIVRDLERFHIPSKIQKATGVKKIERIYVPITQRDPHYKGRLFDQLYENVV